MERQTNWYGKHTAVKIHTGKAFNGKGNPILNCPMANMQASIEAYYFTKSLFWNVPTCTCVFVFLEGFTALAWVTTYSDLRKGTLSPRALAPNVYTHSHMYSIPALKVCFEDISGMGSHHTFCFWTANN